MVTEGGDPVADAEVSAFDANDGALARVRTDGAGMCRVAPTRVIAEIAVRRDGFAVLVAVPDALPESGGRRVARLVAERIVHGTVRRPSGAPPSSPVLVTAWSARTPLVSPEDARRAEAGDPRVLTTRTDAAGNFAIRGAPADADLRLIAAGDGMAQTRLWVLARAGASEAIDLVVVPLFVLDVAIVDAATNEPIRAIDTHGLGGLVEAPHRMQTIGEFTPTSPGLIWAGYRPPADVASDGRLVRVYGLDSDADDCGPISVRSTVPGYEELRAEMSAHRVRVGAPPPTYELALVRTAGGFGSIEFSLGNTPDDIRRGLTTAHALAMYAELSEVPDGIRVWTGLAGIGEGPIVVANVPEGTYRTWIKIPLGVRSACSRVRTITVDRDRTTRVVWELPDAAAIELRPRRADGTDFDGPLSVLVRRRGSNQGGNWSLASKPYVIAGFDAGPYEVLATDFSFGTSSAWTPVDAAIGVAAPVELTLDRAR